MTANGERVANQGRGNKATKAYARSFTQKFAKIAEQVPVYANLKNLIDMTIVAAYLQKEGIYSKAEWSMDFLGNEEKYSVENVTPVQYAETAVNILKHGANVASFPVGGGVLIEADTALDDEHVHLDEDGEVAKKYDTVEKNIPDNVWWWD